MNKMSNGQTSNYYTVVRVLELCENLPKHSSINDIAEKLNRTVRELDNIFLKWCGFSTSEFLGFTTVSHAKKILDNQPTLFDLAEFPVDSTSNFPNGVKITIEKITPEVLNNHGEKLNLNYSFAPTQFGDIIIASSQNGICHIAFFDDKSDAILNLSSKFPNAEISEQQQESHRIALSFFESNRSEKPELKLYLNGTEFQIKVWNALLQIPRGKLSTYGLVAIQIGSPQAARAVGTAIGSNPIGFLIPCHRVVQTSGNLGGYMWGKIRKRAIIGWEAATRSL